MLCVDVSRLVRAFVHAVLDFLRLDAVLQDLNLAIRLFTQHRLGGAALSEICTRKHDCALRLWTALVAGLHLDGINQASSTVASQVHVYCALGDYVSPLELLAHCLEHYDPLTFCTACDSLRWVNAPSWQSVAPRGTCPKR